MSFTVKSTGRASLRSFDIMCPACGYSEERSVDLRECETEEERNERIDRDTLIKCPNCEQATMERVWLRAPSMGTTHDPKSDTTIAKFQQSCRERFVKKEMADIQHKHGVNFGDSIRSAAVQRIKKKQKPI